MSFLECKGTGGRGRTVPITPFRSWVQRLVVEERPYGAGAQERVASRLGVSGRRVYGYLNEQTDRVYESVVDRACSREGSIMAHELYPELLERKVAA